MLQRLFFIWDASPAAPAGTDSSAGERFARLAEKGSQAPVIATLGIATILGIWACYAFSGAGLLPRLPLLRPALLAIAAIYFIRAAALPIMLSAMPDRGVRFLIISSAVVLVFAIVHAAGLLSLRPA